MSEWHELWVHRVGFLLGGQWYPCLWLLVMSFSSGFQTLSRQPYSHLVEAYVMHVPSYSPLVRHLLTSWRPAWQPSCSLPHIFEQPLVGFKSSIYSATTHNVRPGRQILYRLSYADSAKKVNLNQIFNRNDSRVNFWIFSHTRLLSEMLNFAWIFTWKNCIALGLIFEKWRRDIGSRAGP